MSLHGAQADTQLFGNLPDRCVVRPQRLDCGAAVGLRVRDEVGGVTVICNVVQFGCVDLQAGS